VLGVYQDGTVVGSGVDYIRATGSFGRSERRLRRVGEEQLAAALSGGSFERPFAAWGYVGVQAGGVSLGSGSAGAIVSISGARAASVCREIIKYADKVSRIDLQATIQFARDVQALSKRAGEELQRNQRQRKRRVSASDIRTFGKGNTLYVGSRASQWFGRIYDKHRESGDEAYRRCWRYEVEAKGDAAKKAAGYVQQFGSEGEPIASAVRDWFRARGITPRYRSTLSGGVGPIGRPLTDARKQLIWLSEAPASVARRLVAVYGVDAVRAVLLDARDPRAVPELEVEVDDSLSAYDEWTMEQADALE
jgi:hypothetical protein